MEIQVYLKWRRRRTTHASNVENPVISSTSVQASFNVSDNSSEIATATAEATAATEAEAQAYEDVAANSGKIDTTRNASQGATTFVIGLEGKINKNIEVNNYENNLEWVLDIECSDHIINSDKYFVKVNKLENSINVKVGDGGTLRATSVGNIKAKFVTNYNETEIKLKDEFFVAEMDRNLISFGKVVGKAKIISVGSTSEIYSRGNKLVGVANKVNNLYKINTVFNSKQNYVSENLKV